MLKHAFTAMLLLCVSTAAYADMPCPPKRYFCWQVVGAVNVFGEQALREKAKACGWSEGQIAQARKCLK